jgi:hypothetical protein
VNLAFIQVCRPRTHKLYILEPCTNIVYIHTIYPKNIPYAMCIQRKAGERLDESRLYPSFKCIRRKAGERLGEPRLYPSFKASYTYKC